MTPHPADGVVAAPAGASAQPLSVRLVWILTGWRAPVLAGVVAAVMSLPTLGIGFQLDDYHIALAMTGNKTLPGPTGNPWNIFDFADGDTERTRSAVDVGLFPWWTSTGFRMRFMRPLTGWTHWVDFRLWPDQPWLMHLHSLLWYAGLVAVVTVFFQRLAGDNWGAGLAGVMVAVNDAHAMTVGWIANRNSLIAFTFGFLALLAHHRWRATREIGGLIWSCLWLAIAMLSKETSIALLGFVVAYAVCLEQGSWFRRVLGVLPGCVLAVCWMLLYRGLGYGTSGSGLYIDPAHELPEFLTAVVSRLPVLLVSAWDWMGMDVYLFSGSQMRLSIEWACLAVILTSLLLLSKYLFADRLAAFWTLSVCLCAIPLCSGFPSDRLTMLPCIGAIGLAARYLFLWAHRDPLLMTTQIPASRWIHGGGWIFCHLVAAIPLMWWRVEAVKGFTDIVYAAAVDPSFDDELLPERTIIFVNAPDPFFAWNFLTIRALEGRPLPRAVRMVYTACEDIELQRVDDRTLVARTDQHLLQHAPSRLFRSESLALPEGSRVVLPGFEVEVLETNQRGTPRAIAVRLDHTLEDAQYDWRVWRGNRFQPFVPPPVSAEQRIAAVVDHWFWFGPGSVLHRIAQGRTADPEWHDPIRAESLVRVAEGLAPEQASRLQ